MTRRSRRELARDIEALASGPDDGEAPVSDLFWADLRRYYGADLTPRERRLLADAPMTPGAGEALLIERTEHKPN